ncbi:MAG TPA: hypothetical protein PKA37_16985, partial [Planctomycetota bacterium]|nr:hypothetical protein [Planctomycetota bacterium]
ILESLEASPIQAAMFQDIRARLQEPVRASLALRRLDRLVTRLSQHHNEAWTLTFGVATLLDAHVSRSLIRWRRNHAHLLLTWLKAAGEAEALLSLACYSEGYRTGCFGILEPGLKSIEALDLGHPLVSASSRRGNDLVVQETATTLLFTGSNMSGKSTFLRSVGLAVILSNLGVRIPAKSFRAPPLPVVTCMRITDNLSDGSSLFFAEVTRLKQCVEAAQAEPASLILLDEILAGTNSRERHAGTKSVLGLLAATPATVLIATHDLALAEVSSAVMHPTRLLHFRETIDATGAMTFDYQLRDGPCPTTNALEILRQAGLYTVVK